MRRWKPSRTIPQLKDLTDDDPPPFVVPLIGEGVGAEISVGAIMFEVGISEVRDESERGERRADGKLEEEERVFLAFVAASADLASLAVRVAMDVRVRNWSEKLKRKRNN